MTTLNHADKLIMCMLLLAPMYLYAYSASIFKSLSNMVSDFVYRNVIFLMCI